MSRGIQDCGVEPVGYKKGGDLQIGDKVSVWWKPKGARLLNKEPYRGALKHLWPEGAFTGSFEKDPSPGAPKNYAEMTVGNRDLFAMMP